MKTASAFQKDELKVRYSCSKEQVERSLLHIFKRTLERKSASAFHKNKLQVRFSCSKEQIESDLAVKKNKWKVR